ncbi:unnamed protein product [Plutella xylostella]|uniref:(diamondback moth) hypothetical protein n=1 Tax=Plutella xylostella TaxID=51655 RepID=A0A8S4G3Y4_PLUXY|nr:unnamed protein product [Plutella xylostella]
MPKRKRKDDDDSEYLREKVRKLEKSLRKRKRNSRSCHRRRTRVVSSSSSEGGPPRPSPPRSSPPRAAPPRSPPPRPRLGSQRPSPPPPPPRRSESPEPGDEWEYDPGSPVECPSSGPQDELETTNTEGAPKDVPVAGPSRIHRPASAAPSAAPAGPPPPPPPPQPLEGEDDVVVLDDEMLELLGQAPCKDKKYGPKIQRDLALRWEFVATTGLTKEERKELLDRHLVPENCQKIDAPLLNAEIKAALLDNPIKKDKAIENKQGRISAAISCIGEALTKIFAQSNKDTSVVKLLIEAGRLVCDLQHTESMNRRSFICSGIKKEIKDHIYETDIDRYLFGEKLAQTLISAKAITKSGSEIKISSAKNNSSASRSKFPRPLNSKPPLPYNAGAAVGRWQQGAPRQPAHAPPRRRPPPPAQTSRAPPPPPLPPQQRSQYRAPQRRQ